MTPEERAVIDAADRATWADGNGLIAGTLADIANAVRALRESRKPKPKWYSHGNELFEKGTVTDHYTCRAVLLGDTPKLTERIAAALNAQEK